MMVKEDQATSSPSLHQRVSSTELDVRFWNDSLMPKLTKATETIIFIEFLIYVAAPHNIE